MLSVCSPQYSLGHSFVQMVIESHILPVFYAQQVLQNFVLGAIVFAGLLQKPQRVCDPASTEGRGWLRAETIPQNIADREACWRRVMSGSQSATVEVAVGPKDFGRGHVDERMQCLSNKRYNASAGEAFSCRKRKLTCHSLQAESQGCIRLNFLAPPSP